MKKLIIFVSIAFVGFGGGLLRRNVQVMSASQSHPAIDLQSNSLIDVRQLTVEPTSKRPNPEQVTARVSELETIPLNSPPPNLADFKIDDQGNIYFETVNMQTAKGKILRLNPKSQQSDEIEIRLAKGKQTPDSAILQSYDVDRSGTVYMAIARPEALLIQDTHGEVLSEIDLPDFLPSKISIDVEGNIWVGGRVFLSRNPVVVGDVGQIRVYKPTGKLLAIPADGFDRDDLRVGRFAHITGRSELIAGTRIYRFKNRTFAGVRDYPFQISRVNRHSSGEAQSVTQRRSNRIVLGLSSVGNNLMSYGVLPDEQGVMKNGFVALISQSGEALTPELVIPPEYGRPVATASNGNVYCLRKATGGQLALTRIGLVEIPSNGVGR